MSTDNEYTNRHLQELGDSDYEIADGQPDITGWTVKNVDGEVVGDIADVLFDPQSRKVRYLIVDLDDNELELEADHDVLVPIGTADLHEHDDEVILTRVSTAQLVALPQYDAETFSPETEVIIRDVFEPHTAPAEGNLPVVYDRDQFYTHGHFNDKGFFERRGGSGQTVSRDDDPNRVL